MGLGVVVNMSGDMRKAHRVWMDILASAESLNDPKLLASARDSVGMIEMYRGELRRAHTYFQQIEAAYDHPQDDPQSRPSIGTALHAISYDAFTLWYLGYPDQALGKIKRTLVLTESPGMEAYWVALGLNHCARVQMHRREIDRARELSEATIAVSSEKNFPWLLATSFMIQGWALALTGKLDKGIELLEKGLTDLPDEATRHEFAGWLAEAYGKAGRYEEGLKLLEVGIASRRRALLVGTTLIRLKGELLMMQDSSKAEEAERSFRTAIEADAKYGAKSPQLRVTTCLARLMRDTGRRDEARAMLAEIYGWFTEGFDTADLKDAKTLLDELGT
jgi:tetratricopeptide (TPR) repeat protein